MAAPPAKQHFEYEFVDMRYNYDVNLLKRFYDELMVPNFGVRIMSTERQLRWLTLRLVDLRGRARGL